MKTKPPKMTELQKKQQNSGSRFIRVIPSHAYAAYVANPPKRVYDEAGRRVK